MLRMRWLPVVVWLAAIGVVVALVRDYGVTWDEGVQSEYGELALKYFASGFQDTRCNSFIDLYFYGPLFEATSALLYGAVPSWKYLIRHLLCAMTGLLAVAGTVRFARKLPTASRTSAAAAGVLLATMPGFFGHAFINSKDIPFACAWVWAMVTWCDLLQGEGRAWGPWVRAGLCSGLALAMRPGGLPIFLCVGLGLLVLLRRVGARPAVSGAASLSRLAAAFLLAWAVMILPWPWSHAHPVLNPLRAMSVAASFSSVYDVLFNGHVYASDALPRYYLLQYLAITIPPATLVLVLGGLATTWREGLRGADGRADGVRLLLLAWAGVPVAMAVLRRPNLYDGMRHFIFVLPALAIWAGWGADRLGQALRHRFGPVAAGVVLALALGSTVVPLVRLHPYQYTYVSALGGGMDRLEERLETDYWLTSYREAAEWLNRNGIAGDDGRLVIWAAANGYSEACLKSFLRPGTRLLTSMERETDRVMLPHVDYFVGTTRHGLDENFPDAPVVHTIGRAGARFCVIKARPAPAR